MMRALEHRIPPPVVALVLGTVMWLGARKAPVLAVPAALRLGLAGTLILFGLVVDVSGFLAFRRARTTTNPLRPAAASAIVTGGVYRCTRNPMYVGVTAVLLGWAVFLAVPWGLLGPVLFAGFVTRFQIIPEERELEAKFGREYADYRRRVGRWF